MTIQRRNWHRKTTLNPVEYAWLHSPYSRWHHSNWIQQSSEHCCCNGSWNFSASHPNTPWQLKCQASHKAHFNSWKLPQKSSVSQFKMANTPKQIKLPTAHTPHSPGPPGTCRAQLWLPFSCPFHSPPGGQMEDRDKVVCWHPVSPHLRSNLQRFSPFQRCKDWRPCRKAASSPTPPSPFPVPGH